MKLLIVTGIEHSDWEVCADSLEWKIPSAPEKIQSQLSSLLSNEFTANSAEKLRVILDSINNNDKFYVYLSDIQLDLAMLINFDDIKFIVFYNNPEYTVANLLSIEILERKKCLDFTNEWQRQLEHVYSIYNKNKNQCLLINTSDFISRTERAAKLLSVFSGCQIAWSEPSSTITNEALLSAKLMLHAQDEMYDFYDEVRSNAPALEDFKVSGLVHLDELAELALDALSKHCLERRQQLQKDSEHEKQLNSLLADSDQKVRDCNNKIEELLQMIEFDKAAFEKSEKAQAADIKNMSKQLKKAEAESIEKENVFATQFNDLKEELDSKILELNQSKKLSVQQTSDLNALFDKNEELTSDRNLLQLQVEQLHEELELNYSTFSEKSNCYEKEIEHLNNLNSSIERQFVEYETEKVTEFQATQSQDKAVITSLEKESELQSLQIDQLQEELDFTYENLRASTRDNSNIEREGQGLLKELEEERELATLQICQLQEELEFYYQKLINEDVSKMDAGPITEKPVYNAYNICVSDGAELVSGYYTDGYRDIKINLLNVKLADGREFESLTCKLIFIEGCVGIEFRPTENGLQLNWLEELSDEYGHFLTYIPNPPDSKLETQNKIDERLSASDRLAILSIASVLSEALQLENLSIQKEMDEGELRDWKLLAIELKQHVSELPAWLSFDNLYLLEDMQTEGYEHLWLKFDNLLLNDQYYPHFEAKFAAMGPSSSSLFTNKLTLELREMTGGGGPLQAWPTSTRDEYGYKFIASVDLEADEIEIHTSDRISQGDEQLVKHALKNLGNFINVLIEQGNTLSRSKKDWAEVCSALTSVGTFAKSQKRDEVEHEINEEILESVRDTYDFNFAEFVDLGGYQHLVFESLLPESILLKIKVRADDVNQDNSDARLALELRTGGHDVPLFESQYFGEDKYGPHVRFNMSEATDLIHNDSFEKKHRELIAEFIHSLPDLIEHIEDMDGKNRSVWLEWCIKNNI